MRSRRLALAISVLLAPGAALALPADFAARHGIDPAAPAPSRGVETGFGYRAVARDGEGNLVFTDAVIDQDGRRIGAGRLTLGEDVFQAEALTITGRSQAVEQGTVLAAEFSARFPGAGRLLTGAPDLCAPENFAPFGTAVQEIRMTGVSMNAPALEGRGPIAAAGPGSAPESLTFSAGSVWVRAGVADCLEVAHARLDAISARAVTGETMTIGGLLAGFDRMRDGTVETRVEITALSSDDKLRIGKLSARAELGAGAFEALAATEEDPDISTFLLMHGGEIGFAMEGLDVAPRDMLPPEALQRSGLAKTDRITGSAKLSLTFGKDSITLAQDADLDGLIQNNLGLRLKVNENVPLTGETVMGLVSAISFAGAELSIRDKGIAGVIEAASGRPLAEAFGAASKRTGPVPHEISEHIFAWFAHALQEGGDVTAAPAHPVPLLALGMAAAMDPKSLAALLNVSAR